VVHDPLWSQRGDDLDGNGLPDDWEFLAGVNDPTADDDGDGLKNGEELQTRTHPRDPRSVLRFDHVRPTRPGQRIELRWQAMPGLRYNIFRTTKLGQSEAWEQIGTVVPSSSIGSFFDVFVGDEAFYLIGTDAPPAASR
jgi:hypothetical protein